MKTLLSKNSNIYLFTILVLLYVILSFILNEYILNETVISNLYKNELSTDQLKKILLFRQKWMILGYILIPVKYLIKFGLVFLCFKIGFIFKNIKIQSSFIFRIIIISEFIFIIQKIAHVGYLYHHEVYDIFDIQYFTSLSMLSFFNDSLLNFGFKFILSSINIFEIAYWFILSIFLTKSLQMKFGSSFSFVMKTYGSGLMLWFIIILFLQVVL